jgi:hypothetical protein
MSDEREKILEMVANKQVSPEEGARLLGLVDGSGPSAAREPNPSEFRGREAARDRRYWQYPLWAGLVILVIGMAVVTTAYQRQRVSVGTWLCGWLPLACGLTLATVAAWAKTAHWVHIRVKSHKDRVSLHFPLPLGLAASVLRVARPHIRQLRDTAVDEAILALREGLYGGEDIVIDVRDDDQGESVNIDFGGKS